MNIKTANKFYMYNPSIDDMKESIERIVENKVKHLSFIFDIDYVTDNNKTNIEHIDTYLTMLYDTVPNSTFIDKVKVNFILIRPETVDKRLTRTVKTLIRNSIDKHSIRASISTTTRLFIHSERNHGDVYRFEVIPNSFKSDYVRTNYANTSSGHDYIHFWKNSPLLRIAGFEPESVVDGPGFRFTLFVQGCPHHCNGCHNAHTWDYNGGYFISVYDIYRRIIENPMIQGVTFSGGEPFKQSKVLTFLANTLNLYYLHRNKSFNIMTYTGYTLEDLKSIIESDKYNKTSIISLLYVSDYLMDGRFDIEQKSMDCKFRGSKNQKMYQRNGKEFTEIYPVK